MSFLLFRPEALHSNKRRLEGEVRLTRATHTSAITAVVVVITGALVLWVVFGHYSRTETVSGSLAPVSVLSKVFADKPGQIEWLGVKDGDLVRRGQPIATIRVEQNLAGGTSPNYQRLASVGEQEQLTKQELHLEDRRSQQERTRLERLISDLSDERLELASQIKLQKQAVESTHQSFDAMTALVDKGFETRTDYEQRRQVWLVAATQLQSLIQQISQIDERRSQAEADLAKQPEDHADKVAELTSNLSQLDQRRIDIESARAFTITAPIAGRITAVQTMAGRSTDGRLPLLAIVPLGSVMQATLYAPSRAIGMARTGQEVRLMYDAFPYQRFGTFTGHIVHISRSVLAPSEVDTPLKLQDPVYEVRVALDRQAVAAFGEQLPLEPGMTLTADIVLDRRSFLDWMLEPLRAIEART